MNNTVWSPMLDLDPISLNTRFWTIWVVSLEHATDISSIYGVRCLRDPLITMYMFGLLGSNGPHDKDGARV